MSAERRGSIIFRITLQCALLVVHGCLLTAPCQVVAVRRVHAASITLTVMSLGWFVYELQVDRFSWQVWFIMTSNLAFILVWTFSYISSLVAGTFQDRMSSLPSSRSEFKGFRPYVYPAIFYSFALYGLLIGILVTDWLILATAQALLNATAAAVIGTYGVVELCT
mmetsp:Transcript_42852/g.69657  ORF Transcript_42852/g.69657 Transcript_42852/m.69657 type:complete len:166 (-) Transcript_42852:1270-1767(-)